MNRENNRYISGTGEELNVTQMYDFVMSEAKRQYEECSGEKFDDLITEEKNDMVLSQWEWQINNRGWEVYNSGQKIS